jgi:hypothetical protein
VTKVTEGQIRPERKQNKQTKSKTLISIKFDWMEMSRIQLAVIYNYSVILQMNKERLK